MSPLVPMAATALTPVPISRIWRRVLHRDVTFDYRVTDEQGDSSTATVTVTVTGVNDAAVTTQVDLGSTNEDAAIVITKDQLLAKASDADGDTLSVNSLALSDNSHGSLVDNGDDTWTYTPAADFNGNDVAFTYNVNDGTVDTVGNALIDVRAVNDVAVTSTVDLGSTNEDTAIVITKDQLLANASDVDGDTLSINSLALSDNSHGSLVDNGDETWTFTPTADFNGDDVAFTYNVNDGSLDTAGSAVIDVTAVNDGPDFAPVGLVKLDFTWAGGSLSESSGSYTFPENYQLGESIWLTTEGGIYRKAAQIEITENDSGTLTVKTLQAKYTDASVWESLTEAQQTTYFDTSGTSYPVATSDDESGYGIKDISINGGETVSGFVDSLSGTDVDINADRLYLRVDENSSDGTVVGQVSATDTENDTLTFSLTDDAGGRFAIDASTGEISVADGSLLNHEAEASHSITVQVDDGNGGVTEKSYTLSVNDISEAAVIDGTDTATVTEDNAATLTASGALTVADEDAGEAGFTAETVTGTYGSLTIDSDGNWSYSADNTQSAIQTLGDGDSLTETITVQSVDGTSKDITVTINGSNDAAVISGAETAAVTEDDAATLTASGKLDITDVDTGEAAFSAETVSGTYGNLTIDADGNWSYEADNTQTAIQALGDGDSLTETITVQSVDGTSKDITVTINGINDAAVTTPVTLQGAEDTVLTITKDQLLAEATDVEGDTLSVSDVSYSGSDGTLTEVSKIAFGNDTSNTIDVTDTLQSFDAFSLEFEYTSTGSHEGTFDSILSMVTPAQLHPLLIAVKSNGSLMLQLDGNVKTFGGVNINDGEVHNISMTWDSASGDVKLFDNNQLVETQRVAPGQALEADGVVTIGQDRDIYGGEFDPSQSLTNADLGFVTLSYDVVSQADIEAGVSVADASTSLALNIRAENGQIVDAANNHTVATEGSLTYGHDHYEFSPNSDFNGSVALDYTISDGTDTTAAQATLNFSATGDAALISGADTGNVTEDDAATLSVSGKLDITDNDIGEAVFAAETVSGIYGDLTIDADGNWSYEADNTQNAIQVLGDGDSLTDTITVQSVDGTTKDIIVTINGTNDVAVISGTDSGSVTEDDAATLTASGKLDITDVDTGEASFSAETVSGTYGGLTIDADGNWSYEADNTQSAIQALGDGDSLTDTIAIQSVDGTTHDIEITINGANDAAVTTQVDLGSTNEDSAIVITKDQLLANASDVDGDTLNINSLALSDNSHGSLVDNGDDTWTFTPAADFNGDDVAFTYSVNDGNADTAGSAVIDVTAMNDAPVTSDDISATTSEDTAFTLTEAELLANASDVDGDTLSVTAVQSSSHLTVVDNGDSTWTFTPAENWAGTESITFSISDGTETINSNVNLTVNPEVDAPLLSATGDTVISVLNFEGGQLQDGWTSENSPEIRTMGPAYRTDPHEGDYALELDHLGTPHGSNVPDALYYNVDTSQGHDHQISLWIQQRSGTNGSDHVEIVWNGEVIETIDPTGSWGEYIVNLPDTDEATTQLAIREVADQNQGSGPLLDLITLTRLGTNENVDPATDVVISSAEDSRIALDLSATLADTDGSETLTTSLAGLPPGFTLTDGTNTLTADGSDIDMSGWTLDNLTVTPPANHDTDVTLTLTATATESDGSTATQSQTILLDIQAVNDAAVISGTESGSVTEDGAATLSASGKLDIIDVDTGEAAFSAETISGTYGDLTIDADGNWSYEADNTQSAIQAMGDGDSLTETITVQSVGGTTKDIIVTINGNNDIAVTSGTESASVTEDDAATLTVSGKLDITDVDTGEAVFSAETVSGTYGSLTIDADGNWSYEADNTQSAIQTLGDGDSLTDTVTVQSVDGTSKDIIVTINGINDAAVSTQVDLGNTNEDTAIVITKDQLLANATDVDGDTLSINSLALSDSSHGALVDNGDDTWTFTPAANFNGNDVALTYNVNDGTVDVSGSAIVDVLAVNDAPDLTADSDSGNASGGGQTIIGATSVLENDSDVEGDSLTVIGVNDTTVSGSTVIAGVFGDLTISEDGNWTYTPASLDLDLESDLIAHWTFDEASGSVVTDIAPDDAVADDLSLQDGALFVGDGVNGGAIGFDGSSSKAFFDSSVEISHYDGSKNQRTINFEFQLDADNDLSGRQVLYEEGGIFNGYNIYIDSGTLYAGAWSESNGWDGAWISADISGLDSSQWHQVALVLNADSNTMEAWLEGQSIGSSTASLMASHGHGSFGSLTGSTKFHDGDSVSSENYGFNGGIDEARLYDRALNHREINVLKQEFESDSLQDIFTYTVSDGTDTASTTLTIDVNRVPEALSGTLSATEDGGVIVGQLEAIDHDTGDILTYSVETQPAEGSVTISADGSYSFNPGADFQDLAQGATRDVTFDYRVTDAQGDSSTATVTVTVTGVNDATVTTQVDLGSTNEDTAIVITKDQLLANASDVDGDTLSINSLALSDNSHGSLVDNGDETWTFTPTADFNGDDVAFTYNVNDGSLDTAGSAVIDVTAVNDGPDFAPVGLVKLDFTWAGGSLSESSGSYTFPENYQLGESIWLTTEGGIYRKAAQIEITENDSGTLTVKTLQAKYTDASVWESLTEAQQTTYFDTSGTSYPVATSDDESGYGIKDISINGGETVSGFVDSLSGTDVDINADRLYLRVDENSSDGTVVGQVSATDTENDTLTFSLTDDAGGRFAIDASTGEISVADGSLLNHEAEASHSITVQVDDGNGGVTEKSYTLSVNDISEAAVIDGTDAATVTEDNAATLTASGVLTVADEDAGEAGFTAETVTGTYGSLTIDSDGNWSYEADNTQTTIQALGDGDSLMEIITIQSVDGTPHDVTITINGTNDAPVTSVVELGSTSEDTAIVISKAELLANATDTDTDSDVLVINSLTLTDASHGALTDNGDDTWTFTPAADFNGSDVEFIYNVNDGTVDTAGSAVIDVTAVNDTPITSGDISATTSEDNAFTLTEAELLANASDIDGDTLSVSAVQNSSHISVVDNGDKTWTFTPAADWSGNESITFSISDGTETIHSNVNLTVSAEADAPVLVLSATGDTVVSVLNFENNKLQDGWTSENGAEIRTLGRGYGTDPYEGEYGLELDAGAGGTPDALYYTVDTSQGHDHKVSLWVQERAGTSNTDHVEIVWNGEVIETIDPTRSWGEYIVTLPDTGEATTQLAIREVADQNQGSGPLLDLITLTRLGANDNADPASDVVISSDEDSRIALDLSATLADTDGSETLTTSLSGLPSGFILTDGTNSLTADGSDIDMNGWALDNLTVTPPANHDTDVTLTLTATATESDGSTATQAKTILLDIQAVNDAPIAADTQVSLQGTEDTVLVITKDQLLAGASDAEGDALSISDVSYSGSDGTLTEVGKLVFGDNTDNNIELVDRLESFNAFSLEFEYTSTGSHSGNTDTIISMATPSQSNSLLIEASNSDGSLRFLTRGSSTIFPEINIHDGATHHIVITWDSDTGDIKLFDNNQLLATKTAAQNVTIPSDGWLIIGQDQDSYGGSFDAGQSLTNAELGHITLSYDAMSQSDIEAGVSVAEGSTNLALNLRSENGQLVDTANGYTVTTAGSVTQSHVHYEFTPGNNFSGTAALDYTVSDGTDTTAAQATLAFSNVDNDAPEVVTALSDQTAPEDALFSYTLPAEAFNDPEGDTITYSASLPNGDPLPDWLNFDAATRTFSGTPEQQDVGSLAVQITLSDGNGTTDVLWSIDVAEVNEAPLLDTHALIDEVTAAFSFDDTTDATGNGHNLTLSGSATLGTGHDGSGTAFEMNGSSGSGEIEGLVTGGAMSVSSWVRYDNFNQNYVRVFDFGDGQSNNNILLARNNSELRLHIVNDENTGGFQLGVPGFFTVGEWVHITATIADDGTISIYKNGELAGEAAGIVPTEKVRSNNYIGKSNWSQNGYLDGAIDEFAVYSKALSAAEVQAVYMASDVDNQLNNALHIEENSADTSVVGTVSAQDEENDSITYTLTNDAGGRFAINATTGEITVANGVLLDHEAATSHTVTVEASDGSASTTRDYTIYVTNANDVPEASDNSLLLSQNESYAFKAGDFNFSDDDTGDTLQSVTITTLPASGSLMLSGVAVTANQVIAVADVENLSYVSPTTDTDVSSSFSFTVSDGNLSSQNQTFSLSVKGALTDNFTGTDQSEIISGTGGADIIEASGGDDTVYGGQGGDSIIGGSGNDILIGGDGADSFIWHADDVGTAAAPAEDTITDFHTGAGGDVLDLSDVLVDEENHQLDEYLHFNFADGDTTVEISSQANGDVTQKVTLKGVDLSSLGGSDSEIINNLLDDGNLQVDQ